MSQKPNKILAIDPMSTFAIYDGERLETHSVNKNRPFFSFYEKILTILNIGKGGNEYKVVVMEYTHFPYISSQKIINGQRAIIKMFCEFLKIPLVEYAPVAIKKSFTGNARAKKEDMIAECKKMKINVKNDHEADAVALYYHHLEHGNK